ncbi:uncharacterized protein N7511_005693 [Penicillium nucicola]|uniref:uncharacterized protein n=1 Tax=Penicillium nucicola TaxID=1850975 RepID=UPI002544D919|nr:uncharacterized protein N7511_005693 [Penicillium nucicola]KAJ5762311.1 hypothetical protein N7511_005693 [Penicillium nucicola]
MSAIQRRGAVYQSSGRNSQFFSASQNLRRGNRPRHSDSLSPSYDSLDSSGSMQSDDRSIYNAIRVNTPDESRTRFYASLVHENPVHEQGLAVNMAMFVPVGSQDGPSPLKDPTKQRIRTRIAKRAGHRSKVFSDQYMQASRRLKPSLNGSSPKRVSISHQSHRKAVSLGANGYNDCHRLRWPANMGLAVAPVQPRYPPPERSPTPPGLPSFGTPEAMCYAARYMARDNTPHLGRHAGYCDERSTSYSDSLRRFFGLSPSASRASQLSGTGIGRAEDGTLVQGRFPYRQSGHGMNIARQLNEHPFHERFLPVASPPAVYQGREADVEAAYVKQTSRRSNRFIQPRSSHRSQRLPPGDYLPSNPPPVTIRRPGQPRPSAFLRLPPSLYGLDGSPRSATSAVPVESSVLGVRTTGDHQPSNPSNLQSVLTIAVRGGGGDEPNTATSVCSNALSWVQSQPCLSCCLGGPDNEEADQSLDVISSRDTYTTAHSQVSPVESHNEPELLVGDKRIGFQGLRSWISSLYGVMFPTLVNPAVV